MLEFARGAARAAQARRDATSRARRPRPRPRARRAPCGCWTAASSGSAPRTTRSRTRPTAWRRCARSHVAAATATRCCFDYPAKSGKRRVQAVIDPEVADVVERAQAAPRRRRRAAGLQATAAAGSTCKLADINAYLKEATGEDIWPRTSAPGARPCWPRSALAGRRAGGTARRPRASARSRARSRRSPTTWATRRRSRARPTSTRACSTATATAS